MDNRRDIPRFLPRRDISPSGNLTPTPSIRANPVFLLFLFFTLKTTGFKLKTAGTGRMPDIKSILKKAINDKNTLDILGAVSPYLNEVQQQGIYTLIGIMEALNTIKEVKNRTYQKQRLAQVASAQKIDTKSKKVEIMKAIRPYIPEERRQLIDRILKIYEVSEELTKKVSAYRQKRKSNSENKEKNVKKSKKITEVTKPIIPQEKQNNVDKIMDVLKATKMMDTDKKTKGINENILETLKLMMNDEQKQTMDIFMKMIQLLSRPSEEDDQKM